MSFYNQDNIQRKEYINSEEVLKKVSQEKIFEHIFGYEPKEYEFVTSPFRKDKRPGCWFYYTENGTLRFADFANTSVINGIRLKNIDCIDSVRIKHGLNYVQALKYVLENIVETISVKKPLIQKNKEEVELHIMPRNFKKEDINFWNRYLISIDNLMEDKVFAVSNVFMKNTRKGDIRVNFNTIAYCYTNFEGKRKKIYNPLAKPGNTRFITNCKQDDIGGIHNLKNDNTLIITKSYKDYRVIKNLHYQVIWFQSETQFPNQNLLSEIFKKYNKIVIFFDNDEVGIKSSNTLLIYIKSFYKKEVKNIFLPINYLEYGIKDPSDLVAKKGQTFLYKFLKTFT
jgi:hypothetical protein